MANKAKGDDGSAAVSGSAIQKSFGRATKELINIMRSPDAIYQIPWFGMIGEEGCGKELLLPSTEITARPGSPNNFGLDETQATYWWFYDNAVVIDFSSTYFNDKGGAKLKKGLFGRLFGGKAAKGAWAEALRALQSNRPRRPLDGMIVAVDVDDLKARTPEQTATLHRKAEAMADRLHEVQYELGVHVPVYIILTGCEKITGFQAFGEAAPPPVRQQMFGWSCPYEPDQPYQADWLEEAIGSMHECMGTAQLDLLAQVTDQEKRDALYLLPREILALREPLRHYLEPLFKGTSYRRALPLRGIYLTGKLPIPRPKDAKAPPPGDDVPVELGPPAFTKQLFAEKIFQEPGLAVLDEARTKALNKTVRTWKIMSAALVVVALLFFWWQSSSTNSKVESFAPIVDIMKKVNEELDNGVVLTVQKEETGQAGLVLNALKEIKLDPFELLTAPTTYAQSLTPTTNLALAKVIAFGVGRSLLDIMLKRAEVEMPSSLDNLVPSEDGQPSKVSNLPVQDDPSALPALNSRKPSEHLDNLFAYSERVNNLFINFARYDKHGPTEIGELYKFLTGEDLIKDLEAQADLYRQILGLIDAKTWPELNSNQYRRRAQVRLDQYKKRMYTETFVENPLLQDLKVLEDLLLSSMSGGSVTAGYEFSQLDKIDKSIKTIESYIEDGNLAWLAPEKLDLSDYKGLLDILNATFTMPNASVRLGDAFEKETQARYSVFRDQVLARSIPILQARDGKIELAKDISNIKNALNGFFKQPYIQRDKILFESRCAGTAGVRDQWNPDLLAQVLDWYQKLSAYVNDRSADLDPGIRTLIETAARSEFLVNANIITSKYAPPTAVTSAGASNDSTNSNSTSSGRVTPQLKAVLKRRVRNLAEQWDLIEQIAEAYDKVSDELKKPQTKTLFTYWRDDAGSLMRQINSILDQEKLYQILQTNFTWTSADLPGVIAFGARDANDLTARLTSQRETITALANEYAQPLVEKIYQTGDTFTSSIGSASRWKDIISVISDYEKKIPGNDLEDLERFIEDTLNQLQIDKCAEELKKHERPGDQKFFVNAKSAIVSQMKKRCVDILNRETLRGYVSLQTYFKDRLEGRFPFAEASQASEAEVADVVAFYRSFAENLPAFEALTAQNRGQIFGQAEAAEIVRFIDQVKRSRELFAALLSDTSNDSPELNLTVSVSFRVNTENEVSGNQIIQWWTDIAGETIALRDSKGKSVQWKTNDEVQMCFRWANNGLFAPAPNQRNENAKVDDRKVCYVYTGRWSLLRMLAQHAVDSSDRAKSSSGLRPHTLRFETETTLSGSADSSASGLLPTATRVYVRVGLLLPGAKTAYTMPDLPRKAPEVNKVKLTQSGLSAEALGY